MVPPDLSSSTRFLLLDVWTLVPAATKVPARRRRPPSPSFRLGLGGRITDKVEGKTSPVL